MTNRNNRVVQELSRTKISRPAGLILGTAIIAAAIASQLSAPMWILVLLVLLPWFLVIRQRRGVMLAFGGGVLMVPWIVLMVFLITAVTHLPMFLTVVVVLTVFGLVGSVLVFRMNTIRRPTRIGLLTYLPACAGSILWLVMVAVTTSGSNAARFAWVMSGDSPNNVLFAREITGSSGILIGPDQNPVPLATALLALFMAPGRGAVSAAALLEHDLLSFAELWAIVIALVCFLAGAVAVSLARAATSRPTIVAVVAACGSILPVSWLVVVYPVGDGFFGSHVALIILFASVLVYQGSQRSPRMAVGFLALSCTLVLSVWSPLVLIPACLGVAVLIQDWRTFRATRGRALVLIIISLAQLLIYGTVVVLPAFVGQKQFLTAPGASYVFPPVIVFILIACTVIVPLAARRLTGMRAVFGGVALAVGSFVGLGALLIDSGRAGTFWTYYPSKFAWTVIVVLIVVLIGTLVQSFAFHFSKAWVRIAACVICVAIAGGVAIAVPSGSGDHVALPVGGMLTGDDASANVIVDSADLDRPTLYWQSTLANEPYVNFWTIEITSRSVANVKLRAYAYSYNYSVKDLCEIVKLIGSRVTVKTANTTLASKVSQTCSSSRMIIDLHR